MLLLAAALTATSFGDWEELEPVPCGVENGAGIVFGRDSIWGVFPVESDDSTRFGIYCPASATWRVPPGSVLPYLANTAVTFQHLENGAVFMVGNEPEWLPDLFSWDLARRKWQREPIVQPSFLLGPGVSLACVPNLNYDRQLYPVPGWLYCLPGNPDNPKQFWRYSIPTSLQDTAVDGIHPGQGAVIADMTPLFLWGPAPGQMAAEYWLQVATESTFAGPLVNIQTDEPAYQTEEELPNGDVYWRTAYRANGGQWTWDGVHSFALQGGWIRLADIPTPVGAGAALAYEDDFFTIFVDGQHCLIALVGEEGYDGWRYMRSYNIWSGLSPTEVEQTPGTALATHIFGSGFGKRPKAVFGGDSWAWRYSLFYGWQRWVELPDILPGPGASLAYSQDNWVYLVAGEDEEGNPRDGFWRHYTPNDDEEGERLGAQGGAGPTAGHARLTHHGDRISVEYRLAAAARVRVSVFDALGRNKTTLCHGHQPAGTHQVSRDLRAGGAKVVPGTYFVLFDAGPQQTRLKVVVR